MESADKSNRGGHGKTSSPRAQKIPASGKEIIDEVHQKLRQLERVVSYLDDMKRSKDEEIAYLEAESQRLSEAHVRELLINTIAGDDREESLQFQVDTLRLETSQLAEELRNWQQAMDTNQMMRDTIVRLQRRNMELMKSQLEGIGEVQRSQIEYQTKLTRVFRLVLMNAEERYRDEVLQELDTHTRQAFLERTHLKEKVQEREVKVQSFWQRYELLDEQTRIMKKEREEADKNLKQQMFDMARAKKAAKLRLSQTKPIVQDRKHLDHLSGDVNRLTKKLYEVKEDTQNLSQEAERWKKVALELKSREDRSRPSSTLHSSFNKSYSSSNRTSRESGRASPPSFDPVGSTNTGQSSSDLPFPLPPSHASRPHSTPYSAAPFLTEPTWTPQDIECMWRSSSNNANASGENGEANYTVNAAPGTSHSTRLPVLQSPFQPPMLSSPQRASSAPALPPSSSNQTSRDVFVSRRRGRPLGVVLPPRVQHTAMFAPLAYQGRLPPRAGTAPDSYLPESESDGTLHNTLRASRLQTPNSYGQQ